MVIWPVNTELLRTAGLQRPGELATSSTQSNHQFATSGAFKVAVHDLLLHEYILKYLPGGVCKAR